jgi:hypothetical protein
VLPWSFILCWQTQRWLGGDSTLQTMSGRASFVQPENRELPTANIAITSPDLNGEKLRLNLRCRLELFPRRRQVSEHLRGCFLHRLFHWTGLQIFNSQDHCANNTFNIFACHSCGLRAAKERINSPTSLTEQSAAPHRKGCYQPGTSQVQFRCLASSLRRTTIAD